MIILPIPTEWYSVDLGWMDVQPGPPSSKIRIRLSYIEGPYICIYGCYSPLGETWPVNCLNSVIGSWGDSLSAILGEWISLHDVDSYEVIVPVYCVAYPLSLLSSDQIVGG